LDRSRSRAAEGQEKKGQTRNKRSRHQLVVYFENGSGTNEEAAMSKKKWKTKTVNKATVGSEGPQPDRHIETGRPHSRHERTRSGVCGWKEEEEKIERKPSSGW